MLGISLHQLLSIMLLFARIFSSLVLFLATLPLFAQSPRETLCFNPDWKFIKADPANAQTVAFNDSGWQTVSAPHTYNDTDTFDDWSPSGHRGEMNQWGGRTWYRKHFTAPAAWSGKKVFIEFEAARQIAEVYLNGQLLGTSVSGFTPFGFDLTPHLLINQPNVLAVMCDNSFATDSTTGVPITWPNVGNAKIYPWNNPHWHPAHGGLYRNVWLHITDPIHITLPLYSNLGTTGAYIYATNITSASATINIEAQVRNASASPANVRLTADLLDRNGVVVLTRQVTQSISAGALQTLITSGNVSNPQRWEPLYPYLYTMRLRLDTGGPTIDETSVPLGIRSAVWNVNTGFHINGRSVKLHGWGQKPTDEWAGLGAAFPDWLHDFTLKLMRDAGGNFVRWGHCTGGPAQIAAGDRYGIVAIQPGVDGEADTSGTAWTARAAAFRDTLIYFRNNPSILIWEGGNQSISLAHVQELRALFDLYDPNGGRAYAHRRANSTVGAYMDVTIGTEGSHEQPQLPVVEGEYNREEAARRVPDRSTPGWENYHATGTYDLTSEQFAVNQVSHYVTKLGASDHSGGANWIFSDSTSGGRVDSEVARASGEVDAVRLPKEAWHACRAMFFTTPTVHIIGHWNYPAGTTKNVYVVANTPKVELFINGASRGFGTRSNTYLFTFANVAFAAGQIRAVGRDNADLQLAEQIKSTVGVPASLRLTPITAPGGLLANGSDVALIDVEIIDNAGNRCPTILQRVDFNLTGPGIWRGGYNSGKLNSTNNLFLDVEAGINRVAIRSTLAPGTITLNAGTPGLSTITLNIPSLPITVSNGSYVGRPVVPQQGGLTPPPPVTATPTPTPTPTPIPGGPTEGNFIKDYSYSGPDTATSVKTNAQVGNLVFVDRTYTFTELPAILLGADYIQLANDDKNYSALDLIVFAAKQSAIVYIAHDNRIPRPAWLTSQFTQTTDTFPLPGGPMTLFQRIVQPNETLTLGSNTEGASTSINMYVVFAQPLSQTSIHPGSWLQSP